MEPIAELARSRGVALIEDCALAVGARSGGRHVGLWGDFGCFSFYPVKHLTSGEGGMLVSCEKACPPGSTTCRGSGSTTA
jgi:dTDP-4-amino-4,6-dideoxygalactose transaminase